MGARQPSTYRDSTSLVGVFLIAVGAIVGILSYLMGTVPMLAFGLACFMIGIMVLYLPESGRLTSSLAADSSLPSLINTEKLLEDLDLDERGIYIPVSGLGVSSRVFVPLALTPATKRPPLGLNHSRRIFVTVGTNPEDRGILLDSPGSGILSAMERSLGVDLSRVQLEELEKTLDSGLKALGIAKVTSFEQEDAHIKIEIELTSLLDLEAKLVHMAPRLSEHVGTPVVSALAASVSKATGRYVKIRTAVLDLAGRTISVDLQLTV